MVQKYSCIFPKLVNLSDEQFTENYSVHIVHNVVYMMEQTKKNNCKIELRKLLSKIESYEGLFSLVQLEAKGFDEAAFYSELTRILSADL